MICLVQVLRQVVYSNQKPAYYLNRNNIYIFLYKENQIEYFFFKAQSLFSELLSSGAKIWVDIFSCFLPLIDDCYDQAVQAGLLRAQRALHQQRVHADGRFYS